MRTSRVVLTAVAVAAVAVTGSAFTAGNDFSGVATNYAGYGQATVSGAVVTDIVYTPWTTDNTNLQEVTFTTSTQLTTSQTASMLLKSGSTIVGTNPYPCTINGDWDGSHMTISCPTGDHPLFTDFDTVGLTVVD